MSERHRYDPSCRLCVPALVDAETGEVLPPHAFEMVALMLVWNASPFCDREAFINVTVFNSRDADDVARASGVMQRLKQRCESTRRGLRIVKGGQA